MEVPLLDRKRYQSVDICIYCGGFEALTDEHIVAFGLGGRLILPKASCSACAAVTGAIERSVLRGPLRPIRIYRRIQSRRRHRNAPPTLPLEVRFADEWETIELPYEEYPHIFNFQTFELPGYLDPTYERGVRVTGNLAFNFGRRPEEVLERLGAREIRITESHVPSEFAKMTAKVAYSMAVAVGAIDPRRGRPPLVRSILEVSNDIGRWFGSSPEPLQTVAGALHFVWVGRDELRGLLVARVQYFPDSGTPTYLVVLGRLDEPFIGPAALRADPSAISELLSAVRAWPNLGCRRQGPHSNLRLAPWRSRSTERVVLVRGS
jgi:hypothetical protein